MSLRTRIVALIGLVLFIGVLIGVVFAGFQAKATLRAEFDAALTGGEQTVKGAFEDLPRSDHAGRDLRQLVATFDGNRHLRAELVDASGQAVAASIPTARFRAAPGWFANMLGPTPAPRILAVPASGYRTMSLRLEPLPGPDIAALWSEFSGVVVILTASALAGLGLAHLAIGAALRPLDALRHAFGRIGAGDYAGRVREHGAPELAELERAFNDMADRLQAMQTKNRALELQVANIQDEERADLARDLHDEIGPHLFAVKIDAQIIGGLVGAPRAREIAERLNAIQAAVTHMQRLVREMLARLRPTRVTELGLAAAIGDLETFWRARRPEVALDVELAAEELVPEPLWDTAYRVVQEALSNAMRHGDARKVEVSVRLGDDREVMVRIADDGARRESDPDGGGYGLIGMRERVRASGGVLTIEAGETGWVVSARLRTPADPDNAEAA